MADDERTLAQDLQRRIQQQVQAAVDRAFGGILDRDHAHVGLPRFDGAEDLIKGCARQFLHGVAEMLLRGLLRERALRPQEGDRHAAFQAAAGGDDFGPNRRHAGIRERAGIGLLQAADHVGFALGAQNRAVGVRGMLDLAHFQRGARALRQEVEDLSVQRIDALAQGKQLALQIVIHSDARIP